MKRLLESVLRPGVTPWTASAPWTSAFASFPVLPDGITQSPDEVSHIVHPGELSAVPGEPGMDSLPLEDPKRAPMSILASGNG